MTEIEINKLNKIIDERINMVLIESGIQGKIQTIGNKLQNISTEQEILSKKIFNFENMIEKKLNNMLEVKIEKIDSSDNQVKKELSDIKQIISNASNENGILLQDIEKNKYSTNDLKLQFEKFQQNIEERLISNDKIMSLELITKEFESKLKKQNPEKKKINNKIQNIDSKLKLIERNISENLISNNLLTEQIKSFDEQLGKKNKAFELELKNIKDIQKEIILKKKIDCDEINQKLENVSKDLKEKENLLIKLNNSLVIKESEKNKNIEDTMSDMINIHVDKFMKPDMTDIKTKLDYLIQNSFYYQ